MVIQCDISSVSTTVCRNVETCCKISGGSGLLAPYRVMYHFKAPQTSSKVLFLAVKFDCPACGRVDSLCPYFYRKLVLNVRTACCQQRDEPTRTFSAIWLNF